MSLGRKFDLVIFNFPHAGKPDKLKSLMGGDGHPWLQWRHKNLMVLFFRAVRSVLNPHGRVVVSTGINSFCVSERDLDYSSRLSGFAQISRQRFGAWKHCNYDRAYGDYRDNKETGQEMPANGYRGQAKANEITFCWEMVDMELPELQLVEAPAAKDVAKEVVSCSCGLLVPPECKNRHTREHFGARAGHQECFGDEHEQKVWQTLFDATMNGQEGMRRYILGDSSKPM